MTILKYWNIFSLESHCLWSSWSSSWSMSPSRPDYLKTDSNFSIIQVSRKQFAINKFMQKLERFPEHSFQSVLHQTFSDNISSYQSVSPADTILPAASSPSPLPSRAVSPVPSLHSPVSGPGVTHAGAVYDRSKLTIPLQRYNIPSSSSSSSPAGKSPSTNSTSSLVHPSVARSLRNIKQSASKQDIQHIELDLNSRLF